jgi:hypothetical protein
MGEQPEQRVVSLRFAIALCASIFLALNYTLSEPFYRLAVFSRMGL